LARGQACLPCPRRWGDGRVLGEAQSQMRRGIPRASRLALRGRLSRLLQAERRNTDRNTLPLQPLLRKSGLKMYVGSGTTASKTEAMYYPMSRGPYEDGDTAPFTVPGPGVKDLGFVSFTKEFSPWDPQCTPLSRRTQTWTGASGQRRWPLKPCGAFFVTSPSRDPQRQGLFRPRAGGSTLRQ